LGTLLERLGPFGLDAIVVDDGSGAETRVILESLARSHARVTLFRNASNQGKGAATLRGMREAWARGFTHALQIDSDGQHDAGDVPRFLAAARADPDAVTCGRPVFDASVPRVRLYGRWLTHALVWLETLSFQIVDSMCGFRVYPLQPVVELTEHGFFGTRMDFDTEILVRLFRRGVPVRFLPTRVIYPPGGTSNFRMVRDNARMAWLHTRLLLGLVHYLPRRLLRGIQRG
jgi:glycosyltransferase involved in cell wall biosynthesis